MRVLLILVFTASIGKLIWHANKPTLDLEAFDLCRFSATKRLWFRPFDRWDHAPSGKEKIFTTHLKHYRLDGDFDGDGCNEILYESLMSRVSGRFIDSVSYRSKYESYDKLVDAVCDLDPVLKLKTLTGMNDLKINNGCQVFGLLFLRNLGNINNAPGDEIAFVQDHADWSSVNTCNIYSYCNNQWQNIFSYEIREWVIPDTANMNTEFEEILKKRNGTWKYNDHPQPEAEPGPEWKPLPACNCN